MKKSIFYLPGLLILSLTAKSQIQNQTTVAQPASFWINGIGNMRSSATYSPIGQGQVLFYNDSLVIAKRRWVMGLTNSATAAANSGADFVLWNYDDAGNFMGSAFTVTRATGITNALKGLSTPMVFSNSSAGSVNLLGGATATDSYRGAEIALRGGTYNTTPGEMSFHTGIAAGGAVMQPERMRIDANGLVTMGYGLKLNNATSNNISFEPVGLAAPTFTSRSVGSRITLHPALGTASGDYAIGIEPQHMWFSINVRNNINGFKFYAGTNQIGRIDGFGATDWEGQGRFKGWYTANGSGPAAELGIANGRATLIGYDRTSGATKYIPLELAGGTTTDDQTKVLINNVGVGIGTLNPQSKLAVNGTITAKQIKVTQTGWSDYVFHKDYRLPTLPEVEKYVATHQHLEGIPSAAEVEKDGIDVGEMNKKLLAKVEELTLYLIEQNKKIVALEEWKMQQEKAKK